MTDQRLIDEIIGLWWGKVKPTEGYSPSLARGILSAHACGGQSLADLKAAAENYLDECKRRNQEVKFRMGFKRFFTGWEGGTQPFFEFLPKTYNPEPPVPVESRTEALRASREKPEDVVSPEVAREYAEKIRRKLGRWT